jgi:hypothetical protein
LNFSPIAGRHEGQGTKRRRKLFPSQPSLENSIIMKQKREAFADFLGVFADFIRVIGKCCFLTTNFGQPSECWTGSETRIAGSDRSPAACGRAIRRTAGGDDGPAPRQKQKKKAPAQGAAAFAFFLFDMPDSQLRTQCAGVAIGSLERDGIRSNRHRALALD